MITEPLMIQTQVADNGMSNGMVGQAITYEKIPTQIYADSKDASRAVAQEIADLFSNRLLSENSLCPID
jgi:glucosamine-6-phosphate deaminase